MGYDLGVYAFYQTLFISLSSESRRLEISALSYVVGVED
jgi:hypothetical protein